MHQYSWRLRLQNQVRPVARVRSSASRFIHANISTRLVPASCTIAGTRPSRVERDGVELGLREGIGVDVGGMVRCIVAVDSSGFLRFRLRRRDPADSTRRGAPARRPHRARRRARRRLVLAPRTRQPRGRRVPRSRERYADAVLAPSRRARRPHLSTRSRRASRKPTSRRRCRTGRGSTLTRTHRGTAVRGPLPAPARRHRDRGDACSSTRTSLAEGHDYFALGGFDISPDHRLLAYSIDFNGGERYTLRFRDLDTGADLADVVDDVTYGLAWADDARTCFYVRPDDAMRPYEVWRHTLGTAARDDVLVFREDDERFYRRRRPHTQRTLHPDRDSSKIDLRGVVHPDRDAAGRRPR